MTLRNLEETWGTVLDIAGTSCHSSGMATTNNNNRDTNARDFGATCELPGFPGAWLFPSAIVENSRRDFRTGEYAGRHLFQVTAIDVHDLHEAAHTHVRSLGGFRLAEQ